MRGYYNDIEELDKRECKELLTYSNSDEVKRQAQFRIMQLEKLEQAKIRVDQLHDEVKKAKVGKQEQKEHKVNKAKTANKERVSLSSSRPTAWDIFVEIIKFIGVIAFWATIIMAFAS